MNRFAHAIYCDDIRQEVGNKTSLIGIYKGKMFVPSFPIVIPKLCVAVSIVTPTTRPFKTLKIKVLRGDQVLLEAPLSDAFIAAQGVDGEPRGPDDARLFTAEAVLVMSPVPIEAPMTFKLRVETEDEELRAGGLQIELAAQGTDTPAAQP